MRKQDDAMLLLYDLTSGVDFPTRIKNKSSTAIDNTFINILHFSNFLIYLFIFIYLFIYL